jgi:hypothetical protein
MKVSQSSFHVNPVKSVCCGREIWKIKVRVLRNWKKLSNFGAYLAYAIHMALIAVEVSVVTQLCDPFVFSAIDTKFFLILNIYLLLKDY